MRPGSAPLDNLAEALAEQKIFSADPAAVRQEVGRSSLGLVRAVRAPTGNFAAGQSLLLVVDQFEELFRFVKERRQQDGGAEACLFIASLLEATELSTAPIYVVLTLRSDFIGDCTQFPGFPEALNRSQYLIPRLTREQVRDAIEKPLRIAGARISPRLVERLLNELGDDTDQLPVLQHALNRTFYQWKIAGATGEVTIEHYIAAGTLHGALDSHANGLLDSLGDAQPWAEKVFRCLTNIEGGRKIRRPTRLDRIYEIVGAVTDPARRHVQTVIDTFSSHDNSLLVLSGKNQIVDISHESLIAHWNKLDGWVEAEAKAAEWYQSAAADTTWKRRTWRDPELSTALGFLEQGVWNPAWAARLSSAKVPFEDVREFIQRGAAEQNQEKEGEAARQAKELADAHAVAEAERTAKRWLIAAVLLLLIAAVAAAGYAYSRAQQLEANRRAMALDSQLHNLTSEENSIKSQLQQTNTYSASQREQLQKKLDQLAKEKDQLAKQQTAGTNLTPLPAPSAQSPNPDTVPKRELLGLLQQITDLQKSLKQTQSEAAQLKVQNEDLQKRNAPASSTAQPPPSSPQTSQTSASPAPVETQTSISYPDPGLGLPKNDPKVAEQYRKAADAGDAHAMTYLGLMYKLGLGGLSRDEAKAVELYRKAADLGEPRAMNGLALIYESGGGGLPKDEAKAVELFRKAADAGSPIAITNLARMYQFGRGGLRVDLAKTVELYLKAIDAGEPTAMGNLGRMYEDGNGVPKNEAKAVELYRKAADAGNSFAMYHLAEVYETGRGGLKKDKKKAKELRERARLVPN